MQSHEALASRLESMPLSAPARLAALIDWAMIQVDSAIDAAGVDNVVMIAQQLYDKYIAPIDVPWIPDPAEPAVIDLPAKWLLAQVIRGFHAIVHRDHQ